ncbi:hypothetical protein B0T09DRAFT_82480 [Sordaria sp. MPI-SDFR-AT-0083]|nr:hypothetical protein B0T09DRAFT_82480 [Sordaria sp. MPI-SDFR-AT-0083]
MDGEEERKRATRDSKGWVDQVTNGFERRWFLSEQRQRGRTGLDSWDSGLQPSTLLFFFQRKSMKDLHPISLRDSIPLTPRLVAKHPLALSVFSFVAKKERGIRICTSPCYPTRGIPGLSEMDSSLDSGHCENPFLSSPPPDRRRPDIVPTRGISYPASRIDTTTHHICSCWPRHLAFPAAVIVGDGVGIYSTGQSRQDGGVSLAGGGMAVMTVMMDTLEGAQAPDLSNPVRLRLCEGGGEVPHMLTSFCSAVSFDFLPGLFPSAFLPIHLILPFSLDSSATTPFLFLKFELISTILLRHQIDPRKRVSRGSSLEREEPLIQVHIVNRLVYVTPSVCFLFHLAPWFAKKKMPASEALPFLR